MKELSFDEETHTYRYGDKALVGVTRVLEVLHDWRVIPADELDRAAEFGSHVHQAIALDLHGRLKMDTLDHALHPYVVAARHFLRTTRLSVIDVEVRVHDEELGYAGTLDVYGMLRERPIVLDWKTGIMPISVGPQTAAYAHALLGTDEWKDARRWGVALQPNRMPMPWTVTPCEDADDWNVFVSALNIHRFRSRIR